MYMDNFNKLLLVVFSHLQTSETKLWANVELYFTNT